MAKHSNVCYVYKNTGFEAVEKAKPYKNDFGLDLFAYNGKVYEGQTGVSLCNIDSDLKLLIEKNGGLPKINELIHASLSRTGESPRYTRPDELKKDIFVKPEKDESIIFAKDANGGRHYYQRCYNEDGTELFTLKNDTDTYKTVFVQCEGYMLALGGYKRIEEAVERISDFPNGVKSEVERIFNESMADPHKIADLGFANILGRYDEAKAHNEPIIQAHREKREQETAAREAKAQAAEQSRKAEYKKAISGAEENIVNRKKVDNSDVDGDKSLIMQLFREHDISIPLKTQGWVINSLCDIHFNENRNEWSYGYYGNDSTVFSKYLPKLISAVQEKQKTNEKQKPSILNQLETAKETVAKANDNNEKQFPDTVKKRESELC